MKKDDLFKVAKGAYDRADVYELVGNFPLDKTSVEYDKNSIGLYHDNGCQYLKTQLERIKKSLQKHSGTLV